MVEIETPEWRRIVGLAAAAQCSQALANASPWAVRVAAGAPAYTPVAGHRILYLHGRDVLHYRDYLRYRDY
jgi:hypothetical protein